MRAIYENNQFIIQLRTPHTPQEKLFAERSNRTFMESVPVLLTAASLPDEF